MIVLGPSGFYNEYEDCRFLDFPLKNEFGAGIREFRSVADHFQISGAGDKYKFEVNKIIGIIKNYSATPVCYDNGDLTGIRNTAKNSEVVWIPSGIDLGAWLYDNSSLSQFLADELASYSDPQPFRFTDKTDNVMMQTMSDGYSFLTVITNGLDTANKVKLINKTNKKARIIFPVGRTELNTSQEIQLSPKECLVLIWE
jgi:hypothetical protein